MIELTTYNANFLFAFRSVCHNSPSNVSVYHPYFVYFDQVSDSNNFEAKWLGHSWWRSHFSHLEFKFSQAVCSGADVLNKIQHSVAMVC